MSVNDIYKALSASLTGTPPNQQINLWTATQQQAALYPLRDVLDLYKIQGNYVVSTVQLVENVTNVVMTGVATFGLPGAPPANICAVRVELLGTSPQGNNQFELRLFINEAVWTFDRTFANLPD